MNYSSQNHKSVNSKDGKYVETRVSCLDPMPRWLIYCNPLPQINKTPEEVPEMGSIDSNSPPSVKRPCPSETIFIHSNRFRVENSQLKYKFKRNLTYSTAF